MDVVELQLDPTIPQPREARVASGLIIPPKRAADRLDHFPEEVYDLSAESHLSRLMKALLGDAGAGQLRKKTLKARLQRTLSGSHFYEMDRFWGAILGFRRNSEEELPVDPYQDSLLAEEWEDIERRDALYRSRITQLARAVSLGATPIGAEFLAEAILSVDCEVEEDFSTPGRRLFVIVPKRAVTAVERYDLTNVLEKTKPVNTMFDIEPVDVPLENRVPLRSIVASSELWEVLAKVATGARTAFTPYQEVGGTTPVEQPRPAFSGFQGEAWSYLGALKGVLAYKVVEGVTMQQTTQRVAAEDGGFFDYPATFGLASQKDIFAGRLGSDALLVSSTFTNRSIPATKKIIGDPDRLPAWSTEPIYLSNLYADKLPIDELREALQRVVGAEPQPTDPTQRFWASEPRSQTDLTEEVWTVRLDGMKRVNYVTVETARYPHTLVVEAYLPANGTWLEIGRHIQKDSNPRTFTQVFRGHPEHAARSSHWEKVSRSFTALTTDNIRVRLVRSEGDPPTSASGAPTDYSLALRKFDVGYRIKSPEDLESPIPLVTSDVLGNQVTFELRRATADRLMDDGDDKPWKSEPQPVNYAVVNLYLDCRDGVDEGQTIDRLYIEPLTVGVPFNIYVCEDEGDPITDADFDALNWRALPLSFVLQKGWVRLPPTHTRFMKLEFTGLNPEPYENMLGLTRVVKMFPKDVVNSFLTQRAQGMDEKAYPPGLRAHIVQQELVRYSDEIAGINLRNLYPGYSPTDSFYIEDALTAAQLRERSWTLGFQPWNSGTAIPRFIRYGAHHYQNLEVKDVSKLGFFVGISRIEAYRLDGTAMDDTEAYTDFFGDMENLEAGVTWDFNPHRLFSGAADEATATSKTFVSRRNVTGVQFASMQTEPKQYLYDDDFRDPALVTYDFKDTDRYHAIGDAQIQYIAADHSVRVARQTVASILQIQREGGIVQPIVMPVFHDETLTVEDLAALAETWGGFASPLVPLPVEGRIYAGVRGIFEETPDSPLLFQIYDWANDVVLTETEIDGLGGQMFEESLGYQVDPSLGLTSVRLRILQEGKANNAWRLDRFSYFDEGIIWEFSNDGGATWHEANTIRNNAFGILTFPTPGNDLKYRVRAVRDYVAVAGVKIRPVYEGKRGNRRVFSHRGPNVSSYDLEPPVDQDPWFTFWRKPLPWWWYHASRRFPPIAVSGVPDISTFRRFYGRTDTVDLPVPVDTASRTLSKTRNKTESMTFVDSAVRTTSKTRTGSETVPVPVDSATYIIMPFDTIIEPPVHPITPAREWEATPPTFSRASTAYKFNGDAVIAAAARFETIDGRIAIRIEEGTTNILSALRSTGFDSGRWTTFDASVADNVIAAPDGTMTADKLVESSLNSAHRAYVFLGDLSATPVTHSVYAKAGERSWVAIGSGANANLAYYNLAAGTLGTVPASVTATITPLPNGWYRLTYSRSAGAASDHIIIYPKTGNGVGSYLGNGVSGVYLWHAQVEQKVYPTTWQIGATARAAEFQGNPATILPSDKGTVKFWFYNPYAGTPPWADTRYVFSAGPFNTGPAMFLQRIHAQANRWGFALRTDAGAGTTDSFTHALTIGWHRCAITYDGAVQKVYFDGVLAHTAAKTPPTAFNSGNFRLGQFSTGGQVLNSLFMDLAILNYAETGPELAEDFARIGLTPARPEVLYAVPFDNSLTAWTGVAP